MKFPSFPAKRLDSRGASHIVLPLAVILLLAVGGTFMMVAKRNSAELGLATTANAKSANAKQNKAVVVLFSQGGTYTDAKIKLIGDKPSKYRCGGSLGNKDAAVNVVLPKLQPKKDVKYPPKALNCTQTVGNASYEVSFGKRPANETGGASAPEYLPAQAVNAHNGYCTFVHADSAKTRSVPINNQGNCDGDYKAEDNWVARDTVITFAPRPSLEVNKKSKKITGYVELKGIPIVEKEDAVDLKSYAQCSGSVKITNEYTADAKKSFSYNKPLKLVRNKKWNGGFGYCVATIDTKIPKNATGAWTVSASFGGNSYLKASDGSTAVEVPSTLFKK